MDRFHGQTFYEKPQNPVYIVVEKTRGLTLRDLSDLHTIRVIYVIYVIHVIYAIYMIYVIYVI